MYPHARKLFEPGKVGSSNFEEVLRAIHHARLVNFYNWQAIESLYLNVRRALIQAVSSAHVAFEQVPLDAVYNALRSYSNIYTTNYDLIPYWAAMNKGFDGFCDFFWTRGTEFDPFNAEDWHRRTAIHYLHGGLHLKSTEGGVTIKSPVSRWGALEEVLSAGGDGDIPLFISEGTSAIKMRKIRESSYLTFCYGKLLGSTGGLVIFGHGLDSTFDEHILQGVLNSQVDRVAIGIYSGLPIEEKNHIASRLASRFASGHKEVSFFESATHPLGALKAAEHIKPQFSQVDWQ